MWYGRGPGRWRFRRGGERGGVLGRGGGEDAAPTGGPQRGQRVGQPQGQVRLRGLRDGARRLEPVCCAGQRSAPGPGLLCGAAACNAAAVRRLPLPLQGEWSAAQRSEVDINLCVTVFV